MIADLSWWGSLTLPPGGCATRPRPRANRIRLPVTRGMSVVGVDDKRAAHSTSTVRGVRRVDLDALGGQKSSYASAGVLDRRQLKLAGHLKENLPRARECKYFLA